MLTIAAVVVPLVNAYIAPGRPSASWLLQPLFVVGGAYVSALLALRGVRAARQSRALLDARNQIPRRAAISRSRCTGRSSRSSFAMLPAASYAAYAVGVSGVFAPIVSLVAGRVLMTRPVTRTAERFEISKTILHVLLGIVVALLIGLTMVEVGALAIHNGFVDPLAGRAYWLALVVTAGGLLVLCFLVDLNRMGLHYFYRDRIIETYLRSEIANEHKGPEEGRMETFVDTMEMRLKDVHGRPADDNQPGNTAPYLLVSAALNLAGSRDLTRKDRKSAYFLFSKYFCGSRQTGYRETKDYQGGSLQLSRALTLSGAAAGTGMGYSDVLCPVIPDRALQHPARTVDFESSYQSRRSLRVLAAIHSAGSARPHDRADTARERLRRRPHRRQRRHLSAARAPLSGHHRLATPRPIRRLPSARSPRPCVTRTSIWESTSTSICR